MIKLIILIILFSSQIVSRENNQIEITTDQGIEVFQNQNYYLLKENVNIISNEFELNADLVKAHFKKDLYDIIKIECEGKVFFKSKNGITANGNILNLDTVNNTINIIGTDSSLKYNELLLTADESIFVDNAKGKFNLQGESSKLESINLIVVGYSIIGEFENIDNANHITKLEVTDKKLTNIVTDKINMFASKSIYSKENNLIELSENVKIIRNNEIITGDYAIINTLDNSYKIKSKSSNKVKVLINNDN